MTTAIEYALMAGASYISNRPDINKFPIPDGWVSIPEQYRILSSGFEASTFKNGTEIVISIAGTDFSDGNWSLFQSDFWQGNIPLMSGISINGADQLVDAVEYYLQVKAANPTAHITLTGHSLGGALAALVGVFFGETAFTFDQVPAAQTAMEGSAILLRNALLARGHTATELAGLNHYLELQQTEGGIPNAGLVTNLNVKGEVATPFLTSRIGSDASIDNNQGVSGSDLHSIALLTAFLQSNKTADPNKNLSDVTFKLTDLLEMIFEPKLFYNDPLKKIDPKENFLERLVKHEAGNVADIPVGGDAMVTRFTSDLWKLVQDGGMTLSDQNTSNAQLNEISKTLIAFAMQKYYEEEKTSPGAGKELFTSITGGIQFDLADVSKDISAAFEAQTDVDLTKAKGYDLYFSKYLKQEFAGLTAEESNLIKAVLPTLRDWYVQAGLPGMIATDTMNRNAFMLGGIANDTLTGGTGADLLVGNAGDDILNGGAGNDVLLGGKGSDTLKGGEGKDLLLGGIGDDTLDGGTGNDLLKGGAGNDTYTFSGNYGIDIVSDSDGIGSIKVDGNILNGATQQVAANVYKDDTNAIYVKLDGGNSLVMLKEGEGNRIIVNDLPMGNNLGISLQGDIPDTPATTLGGDFKKAIDDHGTPNTDDDTYIMDGQGNYTPDPDAPYEANALDLISGTAGNDVINGGGGDDALSGMGGDDIIYAGGAERMRWRTHAGNISQGAAANDRANSAWRIAA